MNLYHHREAHVGVARGLWKRHASPLTLEEQIVAGADQAWDGYEANQYSSQSAFSYVLPAGYKKRTDDYWSLQAHVPEEALPSLDVDGHMAIWQPNGWVLELNSVIKLTNGDLVSLMASYTDPTGLGTGLANGRRATMIPNYAGLLRNGDLGSERIVHAIAVGLGPEALASDFVLPATAMDRGRLEANTGTIPYGALLTIPQTRAIDSLALQTHEGQVLARAAQEYGMYVVDRSGPGALIFLTDVNATDIPAWSQKLHNDLEKIRDSLCVAKVHR